MKTKISQAVRTIALFFAIILSSCECAYDYKYEVSNNSSGLIKVSWTYNSSKSSIEINSGEIKELFIAYHGIEGCRKGPFFRDVDQDLEEFTVKQNDSLTSKLNYRDNSQWNYQEDGAVGVYKATITDEEFK